MSKISETIKDNGLVDGMPMKNISGDDIENSIVVDSRTYAYFDSKDNLVRVSRENWLTGEEDKMDFNVEAFATLQGWGILSEPA